MFKPRTDKRAENEPPAPLALFSHSRRYRYILTRRTGFGSRVIAFVMLNPSRADEETNDRTVSRCIAYANRDGYGWLIVVNLSPLMATDPADLLATGDEPPDVRECNERAIRAAARTADAVVVAWGADGTAEGRAKRTLALLREQTTELLCLALTADGQPRHPLYLRKLAPIVLYHDPHDP